MALDVPSAVVAGKGQVSFTPPILIAGGVVCSAVSVVVHMAKFGDTVMAAMYHPTELMLRLF